MPKLLSKQLHRGPYHQGFTLIEVLVVLIIVGMTSGVLYQALERAYRLQERFGIELFNEQQGRMAADWYRQSVQGLYPDFPDGQQKFHGDEHEFSGLSSNPLGIEYGAPAPIRWKIQRNPKGGAMELVYVDGDLETSIIRWSGNKAQFIYLDEKWAAHDRWPPPLGMATQLPTQIQIMAQHNGGAITIVATPMGPAKTLPRLQVEL